MQSPNINDLLPRLQRWYLSQCDGDWEHDHGVKVDTLDNPGWSLQVSLKGTDLEGREFTPVEHGLNEGYKGNDWLTCKVEDQQFKGFGGPNKLADLIAVFLIWAERP